MSPRPLQRLGPEFSRPFSPDSLGEDEVVERVEASEAERSAVARRLSLVALDSLAAVLRILRPDGQEVISIAGHFEAQVTQTCVVSLQPLDRHLAEDFSLRFLLAPADSGETGTVDVDAAVDDPPETLGPDDLDLGEAVVQQLAIALDPYPRSDEATLETLEWDGKAGDGAEKESPFEGLKSLRRGR